MKQTLLLILLLSFVPNLQCGKMGPGSTFRVLPVSPAASSSSATQIPNMPDNPTPAEAQQVLQLHQQQLASQRTLPKPITNDEQVQPQQEEQQSALQGQSPKTPPRPTMPAPTPPNTQPKSWIEDSTVEIPTASVGFVSALDGDIKFMLNKETLTRTMAEDRARALRKLLRALELTTREDHSNNSDRTWYEDASIQGAEQMNQHRLIVNPDQAIEFATRFERMQKKYEKELAEITARMLARIYLLRRAGDISIASADGHNNLNQIRAETLDRSYVSTPRKLTDTMYRHGFYSEPENSNDTSSSSKTT